MDFRRVARVAAWTVGAGVVLLIGLWVVVIAINWRDEAPSADALRLQRSIDERPAVADAANAYVLLLGLGISKDEDPLAWGVRRKAFLDEFPAGAVGEDALALPGPDHDFARDRTEATKTLMEACRDADRACLSRLDAHPEHVDAWLASENWLLDRYLVLIGLTQWRETVPSDVRAPFPPYMPALDAQRLLLMKAWRHAGRGEAAAARELLQRDLTFWRMALRSSDILISKMIATAAIRRHFAMGNLVLRELDALGVDSTPPESWSEPIDREERSMRRPFAGEWLFSKSAVAVSGDTRDSDSFFGHAAYDWAFSPFFQPQATNNLIAANMTHLIDGLDVELDELPCALKSMTDPPHGGGFPGLYNPVGNILSQIGYPMYAPYAARVGDLEGIRRVVLLASRLREEGRGGDVDLPERISAAAFRDPYDDAPFGWDAKTQSIVFRGLEPAPRGRHAVLL